MAALEKWPPLIDTWPPDSPFCEAPSRVHARADNERMIPPAGGPTVRGGRHLALAFQPGPGGEAARSPPHPCTCSSPTSGTFSGPTLSFIQRPSNQSSSCGGARGGAGDGGTIRKARWSRRKTLPNRGCILAGCSPRSLLNSSSSQHTRSLCPSRVPCLALGKSQIRLSRRERAPSSARSSRSPLSRRSGLCQRSWR